MSKEQQMIKNTGFTEAGREPVAVIGLGCLFPGGDGLDGFWDVIKNKIDAISDVPAEYWSVADYYDPDPKAPDKTYGRRGAFLSPVPFDPLKFGVAPKDISAIDSTQLLGLVAASAALADAGYLGDEYDHCRTSVMMGVTGALKMVVSLGARLAHPQVRKAMAESGADDEFIAETLERFGNEFTPWQESSFPGLLGNVSAGRIANRLNLGGSNMVVDAACGSSLAAIRQAVLELQSGRSDLVVTGGLDSFTDHFMFTCFSKTPALSPDGRIKPYDREASGTMLGEGMGVLVLKRLSQAIEDGDRIYAKIVGVGSSSDGRGTAVFAPAADGQARAIRAAHQEAGFSPATVGLVEGHGTGTLVGDAVEIAALKEVYEEAGSGRGPWCALGSVKSQIGHSKAAAGAAGMIKAVLSLYNKVLPPTINIDTPQDVLYTEDSPFYINTELRPWLTYPTHPRRAAVSAFGFGGSNFHCLLEEYKREKMAPEKAGRTAAAAFSAYTLDQLIKGLNTFIAEGETKTVSEAAIAAGATLAGFDYKKAYRLVITAPRPDDIIVLAAAAETRLTAPDFSPAGGDRPWPANIYFGQGATPGPVIFIYPAEDKVEPGVFRELAAGHPEFIRALDLAQDAIYEINPHVLSASLGEVLYPPALAHPGSQETWRRLLDSPLGRHMSLSAIYYGLTDIFARFGIRPDEAWGYDCGLPAAALAGGWLDEINFMRLAALKAELIQQSIAKGEPMEKVNRSFEAKLKSALFTFRVGRPFFNDTLSRKITTREELISALAAEAPGQPKATDFWSVLRGVGRHVCVEVCPASDFGEDMEKVESDESGAAIRLRFIRSCPNSQHNLAQILARLAALGYSVDWSAWPVEKAGAASSTKSFTIPVSGSNHFVKPAPKQARPQGVMHKIKNEKNIGAAVDENAAPWAALERISQETVRAHENFLALQAETIRLLASMGGQKSDAAEDLSRPSPQVPVRHNHAATLESKAAAPLAASFKTIETKALSLASSSGAKAVSALSTVMEVVAKETGYPLDMLNQDMDLEHDLGLDSIKKVEVLAALGERLPAFSALNSDDLAGATTIKALAGLVDGCGAAEAYLPVAAAAVVTPVDKAVGLSAHGTGFGRSEAWGLIKTVVAKETGYPEDMLSPAMDLEGDLGLDSIKRVEILAALSESRPEFSSLPSDTMSAAATLGDLADILGGSAAGALPQPKPAAKTSAGDVFGPDEAWAIIKTVVAKETGYPEDMLNPSMNLEGDLGLDSIKRVEILAALSESRPEFSSLPSDRMSSAATLGDLTDILGGSAADALPQTKSAAQASADDVLGHDEAWGLIKTVVAKETGYPEDMLNPSMNLEGDLGLDSIKRVEILAALSESRPEFAALPSDRMSSAATLGDLAAVMGSPIQASALPAIKTTAPSAAEKAAGGLTAWHLETESLKLGSKIAMPQGDVWVVTGHTPLKQELKKNLGALGLTTKSINWSFDFDAQAQTLPKPCGLILIWPGAEDAPEYAKTAFAALKAAGRHLNACNGAFIAGLGFMGGRFGLDINQGGLNAVSGALAGLIKSAAAEWPDVSAKVIDLPLAALDQVQAPVWAQAVGRLLVHETPLEVGLPKPDAPLTLKLLPWQPQTGGRLALAEGDPVLVTGGARGVTASAVLALAKAYKPTLFIVGRTQLPPEEPDWLKSLGDEAAIIEALFGLTPPEMRPGPQELKRQAAIILGAREVKNNLAAFEAAGAKVHYLAVDITEQASLKKNLNSIITQHGSIKGFIHGAGVLADRLIVDKTGDDFAKVFNTKVKPALTILKILEKSPPVFMVFFSSSTARFGRRGQCDYAAANEILNKLASDWRHRHPETTTWSFNWGPFNGGMVEKGLAKIFAKEGVGLIEPADGADFLLKSLTAANSAHCEITVLGPGTDLAALSLENKGDR